MKNLLLIPAFLISSFVCIAQDSKPADNPARVYTVVDQMPLFPGGETAMLEYIAKHVKYPVVAREKGIEGKVFVNFVVNEDGSISDTKIMKSVGGGCDE